MSFPVILMFFPKEFPHHFCPISSFSAGLFAAPNTQRPRFAAKAQRLSVELRDVRGEASCLHAMASAHDIVDQCLGLLGDFRGGFWMKKMELGNMGIYGNLWEPMGTYGNLWESMGIYGISMFCLNGNP